LLTFFVKFGLCIFIMEGMIILHAGAGGWMLEVRGWGALVWCKKFFTPHEDSWINYVPFFLFGGNATL